MDRRQFLHRSAAGLAGCLALAGPAMPRHVLLRSSWQTVNLGDVAHTPGVTVTLWPSKIDNGVDAMLQRAFPRLRIAEGTLDGHGQPTTPALREAFEQADFLLHGSGPSVVAHEHLAGWRNATGKPY